MNTLDYENIIRARSEINKKTKEGIVSGINILEKMSERKNRYALYELGRIYIEGDIGIIDFKKGENLLTFSGDLGYEKAYYTLGLFYKERKNYEKAMKMFLRCKHNSDSLYEIGRLYASGRGCNISKHKAFQYYLASSKGGNSKADYMLGVSYYLGEGIKLNKDKGIYYLRKAKRRNVLDEYNVYKMVEKSIQK